MAVAYVSSTAVAEHATANTVYTAPAGIANGDLLILYQFLYVATGVTLNAASVTPPTGFTVLPGTWPQTFTDGAAQTAGQFAYYKIAASESGSYTATHAASLAARGIMACVSGNSTTAPFAPNPTQNSAGNTGTTTFLGLTTTIANELILLFASDDNDNTHGTLTPPTGTTPTFTGRVTATGGNFLATGTSAATIIANKTMANNSATGGGTPLGFFSSMVAVQPPLTGGGSATAGDTITISSAATQAVSVSIGASDSFTVSSTGVAGASAGDTIAISSAASASSTTSSGIVIDASTPAPTNGGLVTGTKVITSGTFSPPASSQLVVVAQSAVASGTVTTGATITDSLGTHLTWVKLVEAIGNNGGGTGMGATDIWIADCPSAQTNMTVSATVTGTVNATDAQIAILVLKGAKAAASQTGGTATNLRFNGLPSLGVTATGTGSLVVGSFVNDDTNTAPTVPSGQTTTFNGHAFTYSDASGAYFWQQSPTSLTTGAGTVTINDTAPTITFGWGAAAEILSASTHGGGSVTAADSFTVSDSSAATFGGNASISDVGDTIAISDFSSGHTGHGLASDSIAISSTAKGNIADRSTASDTITILSSATYTNATFHPSAGDTVAISSVATSSSGHVTTAADSFTTSSTARANTTRTAQVADSFTTSSTASVTGRSLHTTAADAFSFSSFATGGLSNQAFATASISLSSAATQGVSVSVRASDIFTVSDHSSGAATHNLFATASDSFTIVDSASLRAHVSGTAADSFSISDSNVTNRSISASALQSLTVSDHASPAGSFNVVAGDTIILSDEATVPFTGNPEFFLMMM